MRLMALKIEKKSAFTRNDEAGLAVFSGPKGHILMAKEKGGPWEQVQFTEDDEFASKYIGM